MDLLESGSGLLTNRDKKKEFNMRKLEFCSDAFRRGCLVLATLTAVVTGLSMQSTFAAEPDREDAVLVSITATIEALDQDSR